MNHKRLGSTWIFILLSLSSLIFKIIKEIIEYLTKFRDLRFCNMNFPKKMSVKIVSSTSLNRLRMRKKKKHKNFLWMIFNKKKINFFFFEYFSNFHFYFFSICFVVLCQAQFRFSSNFIKVRRGKVLEKCHWKWKVDEISTTIYDKLYNFPNAT